MEETRKMARAPSGAAGFPARLTGALAFCAGMVLVMGAGAPANDRAPAEVATGATTQAVFEKPLPPSTTEKKDAAGSQYVPSPKIAGGAAGGPPANDNCTGALNIGCDASAVGSTVGASFFDPGFCGTSVTTSGVWYHLVGTGGEIEVDTCSPLSDYDTKLSVYTGSCANLACVGGNDDAPCPFGGLLSRVTFQSVAGQDYFILVHGFGGAVGNFELNVTCATPPAPACPGDVNNDGVVNVDDLLELLADWGCTGPPGACVGDVDNDGVVGVDDLLELLADWGCEDIFPDTCDTAVEIFDGITPFSTDGATTTGPPHDLCLPEWNQPQIHNDIFFNYVATQTGTLRISTCGTANFDTFISAYEGTTCTDASIIGCNDDGPGCPGFTSQLDVSVTQGQTYTVRVGGFSEGATGSGDLSLSYLDAPPPGICDTCGEAGGCQVFDGANEFSTVGTTTTGPPHDLCLPEWNQPQIHNDNFFSYVATQSGTLRISTCNTATFDTFISAYASGSTCTDGTIIGCNDDGPGCAGFTSQLDVPVTQGQSYIIRVGAFSAGTTGTGTLTLSYLDGDPPPPPGLCDTCGEAGGCQIFDGSNEFSTVGTTTTGPAHDLCLPEWNQPQIHNDNFFSYVATQSGTLRISTCNTATFDTFISAYASGSTCTDGTIIGCNDDGPGCAGFTSQLDVSVTQGQSYIVRVGAFSAGTTGTGTLTLSYLNGNGTVCDCDQPVGIGCPANPACEACVCGQDSFCCDVAWDGICAGQATGVCAGSCCN